MRSSHRIMLGIGTLTVGALGYALWSQNTEISPPRIDILQPTQEQSAAVSNGTEVSEPGNVSRKEIAQPALTPEQLEEKYAGYQVQGFVHENRRPLANVVIEGQTASIIPTESDVRQRWTTQTDHLGRFTLSVPADTLYDVEARLRTRSGQLRTNEVTVEARKKGDTNRVEIEFADTPDVSIEIQGDTIQKAYLQSAPEKNLEGFIYGSKVVFEDVREQQRYDLVVVTHNRSLIQDEIPVFDKDVKRQYQASEKRFGEITVRDRETKQGIPHAAIEITLPQFDRNLYH